MTAVTSFAGKPIRRGLRKWLLAFAQLSLMLTVLVYLALCPVIDTPLLDKLSTWPIKELPWVPQSNFPGISAEMVNFDVKDGAIKYALNGVLFKNPKAKDIVIVSHGNGGNIRYIHHGLQVTCLLNDGHSVLVYDYEGYGLSEGQSSYRSLARDGMAAFDYVRNKLGYKAQDIILYGLSMGGGVTCEIARKYTPKAIILDSTFVSIEVAAKYCYPFLKMYPSWLFPEPRYDNLAYLKGKHPPVLIVTPLQDWIVNPNDGYRLAQECSAPGLFLALPNSHHCVVSEDEMGAYNKTLTDFLHSLN